MINTDDFKSFKYKDKLLENTVAQQLRNAWKITVPLKYLSNFWRSFEMSVINCKAEIKLKWKKYCVLSAAGNDNLNDNNNDNNIISIIKETKLYVPVVTFSQEKIKNYQNILAKDLKDQFIRMNIKQIVRIKIRQMTLDIFSNHILLESIDFLF